MYRFDTVDGLDNMLIGSLGADTLVPGGDPDTRTFFHHGDKLTVNTRTGAADYEPIKPGDMFHSRISLRFHQWFGKGLVRPVA